MLIIKIDQQNVEDKNQLHSEWHAKYHFPKPILSNEQRDAKRWFLSFRQNEERNNFCLSLIYFIGSMWKLLNLIMGFISPPLLMCDLSWLSLFLDSAIIISPTLNCFELSIFALTCSIVIITAILNGSMPFVCFLPLFVVMIPLTPESYSTVKSDQVQVILLSVEGVNGNRELTFAFLSRAIWMWICRRNGRRKIYILNETPHNARAQ